MYHGEDGRARSVKLCSPAPVTVSERVIVKAAFEFLGPRGVKGQFASLFKLRCRPRGGEGAADGVS